MRTILIILAIGLAIAQNPTPVPIENLSIFNGTWNLVWQFSSAINNTKPSLLSCQTWNVTLNASEGRIDERFSIYTERDGIKIDFKLISNSNSQWAASGTNITWVAVDPLHQSWVVGAVQNQQVAFLLSKTPVVTSTLITATSLLLKAEGYGVNSTNQFTYNNTECP